EALVEGPWARANDEQKHRAQQHAKIRTGLVSHAEKAVRGQRLEAEPPKALPEQDRDFGRYECDQHIDDERHGCQTCQKAGEHTRSADDLEPADEGTHELWKWNTNLREATCAARRRLEKLLDPLGEEHRTHHEPDQDNRPRGFGLE